MNKNSVINDTELKTHFVYAGYHWVEKETVFKSFILEGMKKNRMDSLVVTFFHMRREKLVTKERMENYGKKIEEVFTYILPKLTNEELELVEERRKEEKKKEEIYLEE